MTNYLVKECSKLAQKECKTRHDRVGKIIHWEFYKRLILTIRPNGVSTNQNLSYKIRHMKFPEIFYMQTDDLIEAKRPDFV